MSVLHCITVEEEEEGEGEEEEGGRRTAGGQWEGGEGVREVGGEGERPTQGRAPLHVHE